MSKTLLASASTLDGIKDRITRFYCGESKMLEPEPGKVDTWLVCFPDGIPLIGVRVFKRRNRYRLEMVIWQRELK